MKRKQNNTAIVKENRDEKKTKQHRRREKALVERKTKISLEGTFALLRE